MSRQAQSQLILLITFLAACGGGSGGMSGPGNTPGITGFMQATIDGVPWSSDSNRLSIAGPQVPGPNGSMLISGSEAASLFAMSLDLNYITGSGPYPLGVGPNVAGGSGSVIGRVGGVDKLWILPQSGAAGLLTITARTTTRIAGTFDFTAFDLLSPDSVVVTNGSFDLTVVNDTLPQRPTGPGSYFRATLGGAAWTAAGVVGFLGVQSFSVGANNNRHVLSLIAKVPITATGSYTIPTAFGFTAQELGTGNGWGGFGADTGTVVVTSFVGNRAIGTLNASLGSGQLIPPLLITNASFSALLE